MGVKTSIIIPSKDKVSRLRLVLQALKRQIDTDTEVVIVLDGCSESSLDQYSKMELNIKYKTVISEKNVGRAAARNLGIKNSTGELIIFLDDDRIPENNFIKKHIDRCKKGTSVLGGRWEVLLTEEEINSSSLIHLIENDYKSILRKAKIDCALSTKLHKFKRWIAPWFYYYTGNVSVWRSDLLKVDGFDEKFIGWGAEDLDLGLRLQNSGVNILFDNEITTIHIMHDSNFSIERFEQLVRNVKYLTRKKGHTIIQQLYLSLYYFLIRKNGLKESNFHTQSNILNDCKTV